MTAPYYSDDLVTLYHGKYQDGLEGLTGDAVITDPPYGETSLAWDRWVTGWCDDMQDVAPALWCFGSMRMFMDNMADFAAWKFSHEIIWEKSTGSGPGLKDRFYRVHEIAALFYRGSWNDIHHVTPRVSSNGAPNKTWKSSGKPQSERNAHRGDIGEHPGYLDDGTRLQRSVQLVPSTRGSAVHPTQKPLGIVTPLIEYSVPIGGLVVDPFAGSGTTLLAAKLSGRRAIGFEINEQYAEAAARRLSQQTFNFGDIA